MNCVQRRIFRAFIASGGNPNDPRHAALLWQFARAVAFALPEQVARVLDLMLRGDRETTYARVAQQLGVSAQAARQYGSRGGRVLAEAVRRMEWNEPRWREASTPLSRGER